MPPKDSVTLLPQPLSVPPQIRHQLCTLITRGRSPAGRSIDKWHGPPCLFAITGSRQITELFT